MKNHFLKKWFDTDIVEYTGVEPVTVVSPVPVSMLCSVLGNPICFLGVEKCSFKYS